MNTEKTDKDLLTTFYVGKELYGIEVLKIQEVTGKPLIVKIPLAPSFVKGLINLRGQIATAIGLNELFGNGDSTNDENQMSVVCKLDGNLVSLIVDDIGDVVEVDHKKFEETPSTLPSHFQKYIRGVYKMDNVLMSVLNLDMISKELSPTNEIKE